MEKIAEQHIESESLIAINQPVGNPQELYFTHRKGWVLHNDEILNASRMDEVKSKGCKYLIISRKYWDNKILNEELVFENLHYQLYRLQN